MRSRYRLNTNYPLLESRLESHELINPLQIYTEATEYPSVAIAYLGKSRMVAVGNCSEYRDCFELAQLEFDVMRLSAFKSRLDASIELKLTMHEIKVLKQRGINKVRYRMRMKTREKLYMQYLNG